MLKYQLLVIYASVISYLIKLFFKEPNISDAIVVASLVAICGLVSYLNKDDTEGVKDVKKQVDELNLRISAKLQHLEENAMSIEHYRDIKSDLEGMRDITGQISVANSIGKTNDFRF